MTSISITTGISAEMTSSTNGSTASTTLDSGYGYNKTISGTVVDQICSADIELAASGSSTIDLQAIVNDLGVTVELADVSGVYVKNLGTTTTAGGTSSAAVITVGGASSDAFTGFVADATDKIKVGAGDVLSLCSSAGAIPVEVDDKDILITNTSSTEAVAIKVVIAGKAA